MTFLVSDNMGSSSAMNQTEQSASFRNMLDVDI